MSDTELVSLRTAARAVGKRYATIKKMADRREFAAIVDGGKKQHPRLLVKVADVEAALRRRVYEPPKAKHRTARGPLHRLVRC